MKEIYISTDVESDGPTPVKNSLLSFASVAITIDGEIRSTFTANLENFPGASPNPKTMRDFWDKEPEAWAACRTNQQDCSEAMHRYLAWLTDIKTTKGLKPVFTGYPATYDFMWIAFYLSYFTGQNPFGFGGLCMKSFGMSMRRSDFRESVKDKYPRRWFARLPHTHVALDDALEQGIMAVNMIRENQKLPKLEWNIPEILPV